MALTAGVAQVDITSPKFVPVGDRLYVKALVVRSADTIAVIITVDAVAIGGIGGISNEYLGRVRERLKDELSITPDSVLVNASHCHGIVCDDMEDKTVEAVRNAIKGIVPVTVGCGVGHENRIMENRRLFLKSGKEADVRHAYSVAADDEVVDVGPIDPKIGIVRLNKADGQTLAVIYQFACHPIMGLPNGANTADITGYSSKVIQDNLSDGAIALFLQGCGGDINPIQYKDVNIPRSAEPLGNMLGLSTLQAIKKIKTEEKSQLTIINEKITLPRCDHTERIAQMKVEQTKLLRSLTGTSLNYKTFMPLAIKYQLSPEFPSYPSHRYLLDKKLERDDVTSMDRTNRANLEAYAKNIMTMEELTRNQTNLALLERHQKSYIETGRKPIEVEIVGLRLGELVLITFPGELVVEIGLGLQKRSPHPLTFISGYTNGYIYYSPTAEQLKNVGGAQEDSDCLLAPEWQKLFEDKVMEMLKKL